MQVIHEQVEFTEDMPINIEIKSLTSTSKHWHNCIEVFLVLSGNIAITVESETYHLFEDDIILVNCDQMHEIHSNDNVSAVLQINPSYFKRGLDKGIRFQCNSTLYYNKMKFSDLKKTIAKIIYVKFNDKEDNDLLIISFCYQLMLYLSKFFRNTEEKNISGTSKSLHRMGDIIKYLNDNYSDDITLEQVADYAYLSPAYLSHFFKTNMGVTFFNYLTGIRMNHAVNDLLTTNLSIEQIAANNGFSNNRYFVDSFKKKFGVLPRQFRRNQKTNTHSDHDTTLKSSEYSGYPLLQRYDFLNKLGEYLDTEAVSEISSGTQLSTVHCVKVNANNCIRRLNHTFKNFTSVGRAREILMASVQQQLRTIQKEVGFRYIKFHGILDDSMMLYNEDSSGNPYLTYQYVDQMIDFLLSIKLRPLIQFSFMPKALAKDPTKTVFYNPVILSEPKDYDKWAFLITNLTKHFMKRYGLEEVRSWLFSFWNVPFQSYLFTFDSNEITYELYRITRSCVKACDSNLSFGAPSYGSLDFTCSEYYDFLDYCKQNSCYPDFYNLHCYPVKNSTRKEFATLGVNAEGDGIILSEDSDYMANMILCIKKQLASYPKAPIYITEWAPTASHRDWLNDTCYRSAYIVKNILENYDQVDSFASWCLSDNIEELPYDNQFFYGELGLFTCNGIKKPAYYAYTLLNKLFDILVEKGPGYFITANQTGDYSILLYNYIHISPLYAQGVLFHVTFLDRYNAFVDPIAKDIDLNLTYVDNGTYTMTEYIVNRQNGSAFDEWVRMGAIPFMEEEEVDILKGRSMPKITKANINVTNQTLHYYTKLEPHEIRLIEIKNTNSYD